MPKKVKKRKASLFCIYTVVILCMFLATTLLMSSKLSTSDENILSRKNAWSIESRQEHDDADLCTSEDPCHCHKSKVSCLCMFGSELGDDCIETGCNWHGIKDDTDMYQLRRSHHHAATSHLKGFCDSCDISHCHGCSSRENCEEVDSIFGVGCKWIDGPHEKYCESICSSSHCHACTTQEQCTEYFFFRVSILSLATSHSQRIQF